VIVRSFCGGQARGKVTPRSREVIHQGNNVRQMIGILAVGRAGLEPATYGLKGHSDHEQVRGVNPDLILSGSFVARRVLELAASRDPEVVDAAQALAAIVLAREEVRLARQIVDGGPLVVVHAVELAERIFACSGHVAWTAER
jgi:hypothetical protein